MLWIKAWHIIFMVTWFAGLLYLPRLFAYHAEATDEIGRARFALMERKLFWGIMTPGMALTIVLGMWLMVQYEFGGGWLHAKLALVGLLFLFHFYLFKVLMDFADGSASSPASFYGRLTWVALAALILIVVLVVLKPF